MNYKLLTVLCLGGLLSACGNTKKQVTQSEATPRTEQAIIYDSQEQAGIADFYTAYLKGDLTRAQEDSLMDKFFTKPMQAKLMRLTQVTNADAIIRAQDYPASGAETLQVKALGESWYMVSFLWDKNDSTTITQIPVKATMMNKQCRIIYITPEYNGQEYGDMLIAVPPVASGDVSQSSVEAFVKSFYKAYASAYAFVDQEWSKRLKMLRAGHLSNRALRTFDKERAKRAMDGNSRYDWVIDNSDFDPMWYGSLRLTKLGHYRFMVFYTAGTIEYQLTITVKREGDRYVIDQVEG